MRTTRLRAGWLMLLAGLTLIGCDPGQPADGTPDDQDNEVPVATEVVVDNQDAGFSIVSGEWGTSLAENGNGSYGPDFRYHFADQVDVGVARFTPEVTATGTYTVYIYWSAAADRTTAQPVVIHHADGDTNYTINLQLNGHEWYPLGNYTFNAGTEGYVQFTTDTADGFCNADAIRLMPSE